MSKDSAKFVVHRDGVNYHVSGFNIQVDCWEGDQFYVQRGDTVYKWRRQFHDKEWEAQEFWFHLKNLTEEVFVWPRTEKDSFIWDKNTEQRVERMLPGGEYIVGGYNNEGHVIRFEGNSGSWDFGELTDTTLLSEGHRFFANCPNFNGDVSVLKTAKWKNIDEMFANCSSFNQDISDWDITHVYNQYEVKDFLLNATDFTGDLSSWCMHTNIGTPDASYWCQGSGIYSDTSKHPQWECRNWIDNPAVRTLPTKIEERAGTYDDLQPGDLFFVTDRGVPYKVAAAEITDIIGDYESILHIKNIRDGNVKIQDHKVVTDMAGHVLNSGTVVEYESGEYLVYGDKAKLKDSTGNWDFGDQTETSKRKGFNDFCYGCEKFNGDIQYLKVDSATDLSYMFNKCYVFDRPVIHFRTSRVNTFRAMFQNCNEFNQPVNHFDTSSAENLMLMFQKCYKFNQPVDSWDTSKVTTLNATFRWCSVFDQDINSWNVSKVTDFSNIFADTNVFNSPLDKWDVSSAKTLIGLFYKNPTFNQPIGMWNTSNVKDMSWMFFLNEVFNQDISGWDTSNVTDMNNMFAYAKGFQGDITGWDTSNVTKMNNMFSPNETFNQDISGWDTSNVTNMNAMFFFAAEFDQDLSGWCVSKIASKPTYFDALSGFEDQPEKQPCWGHCPRGENGTVDPCP